jgi:hypothetical protein
MQTVFESPAWVRAAGRPEPENGTVVVVVLVVEVVVLVVEVVGADAAPEW